MRKLNRRQRVAVLMSSFGAILPGAMLSLKNGHPDRALLVGMIFGMAFGAGLLVVRRSRGLC